MKIKSSFSEVFIYIKSIYNKYDRTQSGHTVKFIWQAMGEELWHTIFSELYSQGFLPLPLFFLGGLLL